MKYYRVVIDKFVDIFGCKIACLSMITPSHDVYLVFFQFYFHPESESLISIISICLRGYELFCFSQCGAICTPNIASELFISN